MLKEAIYHQSDSTYSYPLDEKTLCIKLRTKKDDLKRAILCYGDRYEPVPRVTMFEKEMNKVFTDDLFDYYEIQISPSFNRICYYFKLEDEKETVYYAQQRFYKEPPEDRNRYFIFAYICRGDLYKAHSWWRDSIFYQIFVDRFNKEELDEAWFDEPTNKRMFGGNLKGIIQKLDYIEELGVNAIYLTPIFESPSCHKYDTIDYYDIDKSFGNKNIFKELVEKCHKRGIRVILDAVFNHTSSEFFAFKDAMKKGKKSKYFDWYFINEDGTYEMFGQSKNMPKLNTTNDEVKKYLLNIAKYWIEEFDIDGWRLDVANEIDHKFWREFREAVKSVKEDAIIIGEVWDGAESYLRGDQYDSSMNYPFMHAALEVFARGNMNLKEFDSYMQNLYARYRRDIRYNLLNLIDSHDTARFLYECKNDKEKLKLAAFYMFTTIGIPMIFYGDEVGLSGANDPHCRITMDFQNIDKELFSFYKNLTRLRKEVKALKVGEYKRYYVDEDVYAFSRFVDDEEVLCIFSLSNKEKSFEIGLKGEYMDILNNKTVKIEGKLDVEPYGKMVLKIR
ncbi:MAG: alpha-glycosidase [Caloramator sp.]|jgi:glycosidase|uniref:alpha amylase N-terminal ig-like domain-containing protein n=1 Tax=Caloramator sp. TaxID=1871330 RepID=UPI001D9597EE|nr:alpha amylase N-terminal ig-like domain-containing protein [Caloramator sp.]MBZ4663758.1 alpha-glycosidase [Caloramator sp.]